MPLVALLYELLHHWFKLGQYVDSDLWFLFHEYLQRVLSGTNSLSIREDFIKQERVVSVQGKDHLATFFVCATLREDVLDDFASEGMQHKLVHLRTYQFSKGLFLLV